MEQTTVTKETLVTALRQLGIQEGDLCMVHSSMKSFGHLEGGPQAVVDAFETVLGKEGTLAMPALIQKDFKNAYKAWYPDRPTDVGYLPEYFRKLPYVYRSDNATHSVTARGKLAYELTWEHEAYGPHPLCMFGERTFCDSSPWMKMYEWDCKTVFLGVKLTSNTVKHLVEMRLAEYYLNMVKNPMTAARLRSRLWSFHNYETDTNAIWPFLNCDEEKLRSRLREQNALQETECGNSHLMCVRVRDFYDSFLDALLTDPEAWLTPSAKDFLDWSRECMKNS